MLMKWLNQVRFIELLFFEMKSARRLLNVVNIIKHLSIPKDKSLGRDYVGLDLLNLQEY